MNRVEVEVIAAAAVLGSVAKIPRQIQVVFTTGFPVELGRVPILSNREGESAMWQTRALPVCHGAAQQAIIGQLWYAIQASVPREHQNSNSLKNWK
jgi:hypothetical protein